MYYLTFIKHNGSRILDWADKIEENQNTIDIIKTVSNSQNEQVEEYNLADFKEIYISNADGKTINKIKYPTVLIKVKVEEGSQFTRSTTRD